MGDFQKLEVWQNSHKLTLEIYKLTDKLPKSEQFGLTSQIRRACISVESNIAEGENRYSSKDKIQFFIVSRGSIAEVKTQLLIIKDLYNTFKNESLGIFEKYGNLEKRLNSLITYRRSKL